MNNGLEPEIGEIVTLVLVLLHKIVVPFSQVTSISVIKISLSVAELMEMVQARVRGVVPPANSGPEGTVTSTTGVETGRKENIYNVHECMHIRYVFMPIATVKIYDPIIAASIRS